MRRSGWQPDDVALLGGGVPSPRAAPRVVVEVCTCGCTPQADGRTAHPDWPLAVAWDWLTRPVQAGAHADAGPVVVRSADPHPDSPDPDAADPGALPWWDARSGASRRRAVLPLVLLGELQAGVLLRALYELARGGGPTA